MTERELGNLVERAYVGEGGTTFIHYIGVTSMAKPQPFRSAAIPLGAQGGEG